MYAAGIILACAASASPAEADLARKVDAAITRAREALLSSGGMSRAGTGARTTGEQALAALAALRAGASVDESRLARTLSRVFSNAEAASADGYGGAYHAGLFLVLLEELAAAASAFAPPDLAGRLAGRLARIQRSTGGWGDVSRTEFACLGLSAAERLGVSVGPAVWRRAERFLRGRELPGGGWGYREGDEPTGSMTAAAVIGLVEAGAAPDDEAVRRGLAWLVARFGVDANPGERPVKQSSGGPRHRFYYLAGLAALARARGEWPDREWAVRGARALVREQGPDARWKGEPQDHPTEFATLFLVEARRALAPRPARARITFGLYAPGGRRLEGGAVGSLARSVARWSDLRTEIRVRRVEPARDDLTGLAFVLFLAGEADGAPEDDVAELAAFAERGGTVLVEGPGSRGERARREAVALARRIAGDSEKVIATSGATAALSGPAPLGAAEAPRVLVVRGKTRGGSDRPPRQGTLSKEPDVRPSVLVAPEGLFSLLGREGVGPRSAPARAAANVFAWAVSR